MPRIPPQSSPVDAKALHGLLQAVLEEREAREIRRSSRNAHRISLARTKELSSTLPPASSRLDQPTSNLPLPPSTRPGTAWHHDDDAAEEIGVAVSMKLARPKSMGFLSATDSANGTLVLKKFDSSKKTKPESQPFESMNASRPHLPNMQLHPLRHDTTSVTDSNVTDPASRNSRRSWHPKTMLSKLKDRSIDIDSSTETTNLIEQLDYSIPPIKESQIISLSNRSKSSSRSRSHSPHPVLRHRLSGAFEQPWTFHGYNDSQSSDISSTIANDPETQLTEPIHDVLGVRSADANSTQPTCLPILKSGPQKMLDLNEANASAIGSAMFLGPVQATKNISCDDDDLPPSDPDHSLFTEAGFELQSEPPEDDGSVLDPSNHDESMAFDAMTPPVIRTGPSRGSLPLSEIKTTNRRSGPFSFSSKRSSSQKSIPIFYQRSSMSIDLKESDLNPPPATTRHNSRPVSRSQPLCVSSYDYDQPMPKIPSGLAKSGTETETRKGSTGSRTLNSQESPRRLSPNSSINILKNQNIMIKAPPKVSAIDLKHMNAECIALLRAQENILFQRLNSKQINLASSIMIENPPMDDIGLAIPFDDAKTTFVNLGYEGDDTTSPTVIGEDEFLNGHKRRRSSFAFGQKFLGRNTGVVEMVEIKSGASTPAYNRILKTEEKKRWWKRGMRAT